MTEKRYVYIEHKGADYILDNPNWNLDYIEMLGDTLEAEEIVKRLNELSDKNEQLKKEKDDWKANCLSNVNENSILWNEIAIMREQGAEPSDAFEEYCNKFKG